MLKKPPDFGGLTHKIRKIVFSYFRCPVFAFLVSRLNGGYFSDERRRRRVKCDRRQRCKREGIPVSAAWEGKNTMLPLRYQDAGVPGQ